MLARWIATVAALLLACAQAGAHVRTERVGDLVNLADVTAPLGDLAQPSKTAPPARASLGEPAPGENPPVTHCHVWQKSFSTAESTSGTTIWRWDSAPFGETAANEQPTAGMPSFSYNLRFPGQQYDRETGTHYNYFRDYEAQAGRYVQSDPIGLAGGLATFSFASLAPLEFIDPEGLRSIALRVNPKWTPEERAYANAKIKCLKKAARQGRLAKTKVIRTGTARSHYEAANGVALPPGTEADHIIEAQLGGCENCGGNLSLTSPRVNRSFGAQIGNQIRRESFGTVIDRVVRRRR